MMRVDMLAITLSMMGLLVGAWSNGRFWGTTGALLLCVAAVFTKQTQLPAGVAVFLIALLRNPRGALGAAAVAGAVGLGALGLMEVADGERLPAQHRRLQYQSLLTFGRRIGYSGASGRASRSWS